MLKKIKFTFNIVAFSFLFLQSANSHAENSDIGTTRIENHKVVSGNASAGKSDNQKSFSDKIKAVRAASGEWDVLFETQGGPFSIPEHQEGDDNIRNILQKAYTDGDKVQVTVDTEKETVIHANVDLKAKAREPSSVNGKLSDEAKPYEDIIKKYITPEK